MNFRRKMKNLPDNTLAKGVFQKRKWPWILAAVGALLSLISYAIAAFGWSRQFALLNTLTVVGIAFVLGAILGAIFLCPKRTLSIFPDRLTFVKGREVFEASMESIQNVDVTLFKGIVISVPERTVKIVQLVNRKEVYDTLIIRLHAPAPVSAPVAAPTASATAAPTTAAPTTAAPASSTPTSSANTLAESKIRYFLNLLSAGAITEEQFKAYAEQVLKGTQSQSK